MYVTDEMRETYNIPKQFNIVVDYGTFSQSQWNEWCILNVEGLIIIAVR